MKGDSRRKGITTAHDSTAPLKYGSRFGVVPWRQPREHNSIRGWTCRMETNVRLAVLIVILSGWPPACCFAEPADHPPRFQPVERELAATVNGQPVYFDEIEGELISTLGNDHANLPAETRQQVLGFVLQLLIDRELILEELRRRNLRIDDDELKTLFEAHAKEIERDGKSLQEVTSEQGLSQNSYRRRFEWNQNWAKFLAVTVTEETLKRVFEENRREFDGTKVRVSHILLRAREDGAGLAALVERAKYIKELLDSRKLTFPEAARQYSAAPSRARAGDLGFISRRNEMVEAFSKAAFSLEVGEVGPPTVTPFGVHLIKCTGIEPGNGKWNGQKELLRQAAAKELFNGLASRLRSTAKIEYAESALRLSGIP